jgi:hypothetical protein
VDIIVRMTAIASVPYEALVYLRWRTSSGSQPAAQAAEATGVVPLSCLCIGGGWREGEGMEGREGQEGRGGT